ncbi:MAG: trans-acting enoyl reductase family protein [Aureispira sp.]
MAYDIILYGATGFTGKQAVIYFQKNAPKDIKWAIAARNAKKLDALKQELQLSVDSLVADAQDAKAIDELVQQTKIILTTAGPYALYGSNLLGSCAKHGVHYLDITGEAPWVRDMLQQHGQAATESGAKIVPFCGFDSIPADLSVSILRRYVREEGLGELSRVNSYYTLAKGGLNGGTLLSLLNMLEKGESKSLVNPKLLLGDVQATSFLKREKYNWKAQHVPAINKWVYPFFMEAINQKVVYRSIGLAPKYDLPQPEKFIYNEYHAIGKKSGPAKRAAYGMAAFAGLGKFAFFRSLLKKFGPSSGEGPSQENIEEGFFKVQQIGQTTSGKQVQLTFSYPGDAGNKATICFLCESAFCLLLEKDKLPDRKGFLTPSLAFGEILEKRLLDVDTSIKIITL